MNLGPDGTKWPGEVVKYDDLPRSLGARYEYLAFKPYDHSAAFAYASINEWIDVSYGAWSVVQDALMSVKDNRLLLQEWEYVEGGRVNWRDKGIGALVETEEPVSNNEEQAKWLTPALTRIGRELIAWIRKQHLSDLLTIKERAGVPVAKGKGSPYWIPGSNRDAAVMLAKLSRNSSSVEEALRLTEQVASARVKSCLTVYGRTQAGRKARTLWSVVGGWLTPVGERVGPKNRRILACPFGLNVGCIAASEIAMAGLKGLSDKHAGTTDLSCRIALATSYLFATDLTTFDETIAYETIALIISLIVAPMCDLLMRLGVLTEWEAFMAVDALVFAQEIDMIAPPPHEGEGARRLRTRGRNKSGIRWTSWIATVVQRARTMTKAQDLGATIQFDNFGDDLLVGTDDLGLERKWHNPNYDNHGFIEKTSVDAAFLMQRIVKKSATKVIKYNYLGRMVIGSINREPNREPHNPLAAASAMQIRNALLIDNPVGWAYLPAMHAAGPALHEAAVLAESTPPSVLMLASAQTQPKGDVYALEETIIAADRALQMGLISQSDRDAIVAASKERAGRSEMSYKEFMYDVDRTATEVAIDTIRRMAYTTG